MSECDDCPGYCCIGDEHSPFTPLLDSDIVRIADYFQIPTDKFREEFTAPGGLAWPNAHRHIKFGPAPGIACIFLRQGRCGIYDVRPAICKSLLPIKRVGDITCKMYNKRRIGL
jgi:Fe-S-cluster containining protein